MRLRGSIALLALAAALSAACRGTTSERPPIHLNPNMDQQTRIDPQEGFPFFADGRGNRMPVPGTVPFGSLDASEHRRLGTVAGVPATTLPPELPLTRALLDRGRDRYAVYCSPCHGVAGAGNGPVVARGMMQPPSFHDPRLRAMPIGQVFDVASNGIRNMPGYAAQVPMDDRWAVAAYVRALQVSQFAPYEAVPADVRAARSWAPPAPKPEPAAPPEPAPGKRGKR